MGQKASRCFTDIQREMLNFDHWYVVLNVWQCYWNALIALIVSFDSRFASLATVPVTALHGDKGPNANLAAHLNLLFDSI